MNKFLIGLFGLILSSSILRAQDDIKTPKSTVINVTKIHSGSIDDGWFQGQPEYELEISISLDGYFLLDPRHTICTKKLGGTPTNTSKDVDVKITITADDFESAIEKVLDNFRKRRDGEFNYLSFDYLIDYLYLNLFLYETDGLKGKYILARYDVKYTDLNNNGFEEFFSVVDDGNSLNLRYSNLTFSSIHGKIYNPK